MATTITRHLLVQDSWTQIADGSASVTVIVNDNSEVGITIASTDPGGTDAIIKLAKVGLNPLELNGLEAGDDVYARQQNADKNTGNCEIMVIKSAPQ